ncbi:MAG: Mut7-C RNAse domain-containing protein [Desulfosoma sp.]|uniref:Mut7-C RNAse domain-containing protein n=1 Tax=Desulfosoma sp. TaxID=2603217 RepID=UPI0040495440
MEHRPRFFVDRMLGKVAKCLRILGYDARYGSIETASQIQTLRHEGYVVVTGNTRWRHVPGVLFCQATRWPEQCRKLADAGLVRLEEADPFSRCLQCNGVLEDVAKEEIAGRVPEFVYATAPAFSRCPSCGRVYWPGSHLDKMTDHFQRIMGWNLKEAGKRRSA